MKLTGKHVVEELDGVRCTIVERGISSERKAFLTRLLTGNGLVVKSIHDKDKEGNDADRYTLGVTDLVFNPVIALYQKSLWRSDGHVVNLAYWEENLAEADIPYWQMKR